MTLSHAFEFLTEPPANVPGVVAVFGSDATLRCWAMGAVVGEGDVIQFDGDAVAWSDLRDELATASLFDCGGKRTVVVRGADKFVGGNRPEIERYLAKPGEATRLVLELNSLVSNTRIYKNILS
ncbi:MAG: DNA polymerase III subunit delta, partial [Pirellulales bacterium]|nr:DNA polymerase III subunit delta [Pirellulales bacterium]